jgi:aspartyl-tRNA(Asn)/glutamyl-tRNA(Gln) amidotransferase subunit A
VNLHDLTVAEARQQLDSRAISARELTDAILERVDAIDSRVGAYVTVTADIARQQAAEADARIARGEAASLTGIPGLVKDLIATAGVRTTCSSRMLENYIPPYNATVYQKLVDQSFVMIGKGNMDEFAMGSSTENSAFHPTRNPWDLDRVPGGSSGGSAAGMAAGECLFALGSDTGGSIRQPAALTGIVGLKPTYGRVSRFGLVAFASSLDQIGPMTRTVEDAAIVLQAIAGYDPCDSTSLPVDVPDYRAALTGDVNGLRIGVPREYFVEGIDPAVESAVREAARVYESLGATVDWDVSLPSTRYALAVYYIIAPSEASANLARYDGVKYGYSDRQQAGMWESMMQTREQGFGPEVKRRIIIGTYALSSGYYDAYYLKAQKVRTVIKQEFDEVFGRYDLLLTPTTTAPAFRIGEKVDDPLSMYLNDVCTIPVNIAGIPALALPGGFAGDLPIGIQLMGPALSEELLLRAGDAYQRVTAWHTRRPALESTTR